MKKVIKRFGLWLGGHRKAVLAAVIFLAVLVGTATYSYKLGQDQGKKSVKKAPDFASMFKNLPKKSTTNQTPQSTTPKVTSNSGFFRLTGIVQKVDKSSISLKLENNSVVVLQLKEGQTYLQNGSQQSVQNIKRNTTIVTTGSIKPDGSFLPTVIQAK